MLNLPSDEEVEVEINTTSSLATGKVVFSYSMSTLKHGKEVARSIPPSTSPKSVMYIPLYIPYLLFIFHLHFTLLTYLFVTVWLPP